MKLSVNISLLVFAPLAACNTIVAKTGISAMQIAVLDTSRVLVFDRIMRSPLMVNGHLAWGEVFNVNDYSNTPIPLVTNGVCATGSFLSNGTLVNIGGAGPPSYYNAPLGWQSIRLFDPSQCSTKNCPIYDNPNRTHLTSNRWYASSVRLPDGSVMAVGGSTKGVLFTPNDKANNPTIEYFPPKGDGKAVPLAFLQNAQPQATFPHVQLLPNGQIFMAAKNIAIVYNYQAGTSRDLPTIPGAQRNYPTSGTAALLPLDPANGYTPTSIVCGGSSLQANQSLDSRFPAASDCVYMNPQTDTSWKVIQMHSKRVMGDFVHLPDGTLLILNGASDGVQGYSATWKDGSQTNAHTANLQPELLDPKTMTFSIATWATQLLPRGYHSTATLLPDSRIMIAGSNPHGHVVTNDTLFNTEYRVEMITPPYMVNKTRSTIVNNLGVANNYGAVVTAVLNSVPNGTVKSDVVCRLMDLGFVTHGNHMDHRSVMLISTLSGNNVTFTMPPNATIYPPGPGYLFITIKGVPVTLAKRFLVGTANQQPPTNKKASAAAQAAPLAPSPSSASAATSNPMDCEFAASDGSCALPPSRRRSLYNS